ncbi:MAG TPA: aspartate aminotransferase family protein [Methanocorpusculum sp.]|nr:aspartate aminotransferase family protein [Methanocorpusculum sp.]HJJ53098.1 aspartate aminotransferase family protein [Methanocorpusculum sp.]
MGLENTNDVLMETTLFEEFESNVRSYCRKYPVIFSKAKGSLLIDQNGVEYIDLLCGAGSCNYGHNNDYIKEKVIEYLQNDGILHGLDMYSVAKGEFIQFMQKNILQPRGLNYKILFPGPTGTNAVEAALKIARKAKGRSNVLALMGGFHGMTLGALALTTERTAREAAGVILGNVTHVPHPTMMKNLDTIEYIDMILSDDHSGVDKPAAIIIESVQGEGGVNIVSDQWLKDIRALCDKHDMLLILDEIQTGCCRTGAFFSFERGGIVPDIIVMAKSIGGIGMPSAIVLVKPEFDVLMPGEHNGTFRGFQLSFIAGKAALEFMLANHIEEETVRKGKLVQDYLAANLPLIDPNMTFRGLGLMWGIDLASYPAGTAQQVRHLCFENRVVLELSGREDSVVKLMPALTTDDATLLQALEVVRSAITQVVTAARASQMTSEEPDNNKLFA